MAKDLLLNNVECPDTSVLFGQLMGGGFAPFYDADEVSIGSQANIVAAATGTFTVASATTSSPEIAHGMSVTPDIAVVFPLHWHDTIDNNFAVGVTSRIAHAGSGRRSVSDATVFGTYGIDASKITDTTIRFSCGAYNKFQPTYTDVEGNTGQQVYRWVALKFADETEGTE